MKQGKSKGKYDKNVVNKPAEVLKKEKITSKMRSPIHKITYNNMLIGHGSI